MNRDWTRQYWDFMMNENYELGFDIKEKHLPKSLFKYRKLNSKTIENIAEKTIWLAEIASLNDPFECSLQFDNNECLRLFFTDNKFHATFKKKYEKELTSTDINNIVKSHKPYATYTKICHDKNIILHITPDKQLETIQKRWKQIIEETNQNIRICSFSELYDSLLLWSHYADEHKGICIEYDLFEEDKIRPFLQPIVYSDKVYKIGIFEELTTLKKIGSTLIKCKEWEYEAEWRLTIFKQGKVFPNKMTVSNPKAVYLGTRFHHNEENLKKQLFKILEERNIAFFQMTKHPEEYKLVNIEKNKNHIY